MHRYKLLLEIVDSYYEERYEAILNSYYNFGLVSVNWLLMFVSFGDGSSV